MRGKTWLFRFGLGLGLEVGGVVFVVSSDSGGCVRDEGDDFSLLDCGDISVGFCRFQGGVGGGKRNRGMVELGRLAGWACARVDYV